MSAITQAEANAGISRRALGAKLRKTSTEETISGFKCTAVIDTPMRKLEVLESIHDGRVQVRNTEFNGIKADVELIHMEYHEAQALADVLRSLDAPAKGQA
jgi:hypothetical protein